MVENAWSSLVRDLDVVSRHPIVMDSSQGGDYNTKWVTLDKSLVSAVDFVKLGVLKPTEKKINFKKGDKYILKGKECDGFKMQEEVYEVYGTSDKMDDTDDMELNSIIVKELTPPRGTLHTLSKSDCEWLGVDFEVGLQLMPKSLNWQPYEKEAEFDPNDLSSTYSFNSTDTIHNVLLKVNGFQSYMNSKILTPSGRVISEDSFKKSLTVSNNIPLVRMGIKSLDASSDIPYRIINIDDEKYSRSNILTDSNSLYILVSLEDAYNELAELEYCDKEEYVGIDKDYVKGVSPSDFFSISWDEFGAYTLEEYEAKLEKERKERERKIAEEEAKLKRRREAEEIARREQELAKKEEERKLKDTVNKCINSLCSISVSLPFDTSICDSIMDFSIPTSVKVDSIDGIMDSIAQSMDSLNGMLDNTIESINSIDINQINSIGYKYKDLCNRTLN